MGIYYVVDRIFEASDIEKKDPTDYLRCDQGTYTVASSSRYGKRFLDVFKEFAPAKEFFKTATGPSQVDIVKLWQVSSWTQKGAANRCMKSEGQVIDISYANDLDRRKKERIIDEAMLRLAENSDLPVNKIADIYDSFEKVLDKNK